MIFFSLPTGPLEVNCYVVGSENSGDAVVVDPGGHVDEILNEVEKRNLKVKWIINTHGHFDHIGGNSDLVERTGAELMIHAADIPVLQGSKEHASVFGLTTTASPVPERTLSDGEVLSLGDMEFRVIHTPGHSPGGICLLIEDRLIVGDTLFAGSIGRTDLPGGNHEQLISNIKDKLLVLPDTTRVYPGHGPSSTIGQEKQFNPFLA